MLPLVRIRCPCCGEPIAIAIDDAAGEQHYIEDCQVCCRPIEVAVGFDDHGGIEVSVRAEHEG